MTSPTVLVRAYDGRPVKMVAMAAEAGVIYVANPNSMRRVERGEASPVGFPESDVYEYADDAFEVLRTAWEKDGFVGREYWRHMGLKRYSGMLPSASSGLGRRGSIAPSH